MSALHPLLSAERLGAPALDTLFAAIRDQPGVVADLLWEMRGDDARVVPRATWLLLRLVRSGREIAPADLCRIATRAGELEPWSARIHVCQIFCVVPCPAEAEGALFSFLADCLRDPRAIIRAWALTAAWPFRKRPECAEEIQLALRAARSDPTAAVQARLRQMGLAPRPARPASAGKPSPRRVRRMRRPR